MNRQTTTALALVLFAIGGLTAGLAKAQATGPDIFVSKLLATRMWGQVGEIVAYSVGTESCNDGDEDALWIANTNEHPVIAQNLYRLDDGAFEQIGMSWLKHGFLAINDDACGLDCIPPGGFGGDALGPGCSDPYDPGLNGSQGGLGPRAEVNASSGQFAYPFRTINQTGDDIYKRIQVQTADVRPELNPDAFYFIEGQYVTRDDAVAGNSLNNASYRQVSVDGNLRLDFEGPTRQKLPAIYGWKELDPEVLISTVDVAGDGRFTIGSRATQLVDGRWRYDYAVHNLNSHRSARGFWVPMSPDAVLSATNFHDVDYHSGEPSQSTDWTHFVLEGAVAWGTDSFNTNRRANALRWGTMYSFRIETDVPPGEASGKIALFRPGSPSQVTFNVVAPIGTP